MVGARSKVSGASFLSIIIWNTVVGGTTNKQVPDG